MMQNVIICMLNSKYIHSGLAPWCLLAGIKKYCSENVSAKVIESNINADMNRLKNEIIQNSPKVLGMCCYIWNIETVLNLTAEIRRLLPDCKIVLGGPEVSYNAEKVLLENFQIDYIVSGEGELPFALLCEMLVCPNGCQDFKNIPGLCYRNKNQMCISSPYISNEPPPSPYCDEYFENLNQKIAYTESSRGCPFSCAFCLSGRCGSVRYFDEEQTLQNIVKLSHSGTKTVKFVDRTFNANAKRAVRIWRFIATRYGKDIPNSVCFHFEIDGSLLDAECMQVLSEMPVGSIQLEIGIQSFNPKTLRAINRKTNTDVLFNNIKKLISFGNIHIHTDLIAGLPYENYDSFKKSFNTAFALSSNMLQLGFLKLLHGSPMRENIEKFPCEFSQRPPYEVISTPYLSAEEIKKIKLTEDSAERIVNSGKFEYSFKYVTSSLSLSPFDILLKFGEYVSEFGRVDMPLFDYAKLYFEFFSEFSEINADVLSDKMICDFFSFSRYGKLPNFLKRHDARIKYALNYLSENPETQKAPTSVRAIAILKSENRVVYCDSPISKEYDSLYKDRVSGRYKLNFFDISKIPELSDKPEL